MSSILEGADKAYLREYNESEDEKRLGALQDSLGSIRQATKGGKYLGDDVIQIMIAVQNFAEKLGIDPKELDYAEDQVRQAQNDLESAIYGLEEPFTDMISALQSRIDDARMDAEDDLEEGQRCWKGYKKKGTKKMFGKTVNNCVKADESVEFDQGAFDNIFKPRIQYKQDKKREPRPYDNHPTKRSPQPYDKGPNKDEKLKEFQRGSFDDDKPKRPKKGKLVTKDGQEVVLPLRTQDFRGDEVIVTGYQAPHKYGSTGRIYTDDGMSYFPSVVDLKIIDHDFSDDVDESRTKKSSIGSVMEMYDDVLYLMYIDGKLAMPSPIEKKDMNKYERLILNVLPGSEVKFKGTPRHHYSAEELAEGKGAIRKTLAGILLLGGLLGLNNHQAQKVYDQSHQLQQLTQVYMVAKDRGDEAKMKDVKRRIGNHKMRLDLGKGDVDFDGRPGDDDIKDIDYINPIEER